MAVQMSGGNASRALLKLALLGHDEILKIAKDPDQEPRVPIVPGLIQKILFTRQFVPSYLALIVALTILRLNLRLYGKHWSAKSRRGCQEDERQASSVASSSSSTLQGTESPTKVADSPDERTTLLSEGQTTAPIKRTAVTRCWHRLRSFLLYQPKPIYAVTAAKNTIPANETSVVILIALVVNVFYLFYEVPLSRPMAFVFADRAGLLFVVNLPVLYLLAAKNSQPFQFMTGWSYEGLNIFHRRIGEFMTVLAVLHMVGMVIAFYDLIAPFGYTLGWYLTRKIIIFGCIAFTSYMVIYITSIGYFRQSNYETFLALHVLVQVMALVMLFLHHPDARPYVGAALAIWATDRLVARTLLKKRSFVATLQITDDKETILMHIDVPVKSSYYPGLRNGWHAGQHTFVTLPAMDATQIFQAHPFTIASPAPPRASASLVWPLQLIIRAQDGFSRSLLEYAKYHQHALVQLDGPYSDDAVLRAVTKADRVCFIAGGSGIAVTYPLAWSRQVQAQSPTANTIIKDMALYSNGIRINPKIMKTNHEIDSSSFAHFWVRQDSRHESWLKLLPRSATRTPNEGSEIAVDLVTHRFETRGISGEHRRPDIQLELEAWVKGDFMNKIDASQSICVIVSGPDGLVRDVQNAVASLVQQGWRLEVHVEKFGW